MLTLAVKQRSHSQSVTNLLTLAVRTSRSALVLAVLTASLTECDTALIMPCTIKKHVSIAALASGCFSLITITQTLSALGERRPPPRRSWSGSGVRMPRLSESGFRIRMTSKINGDFLVTVCTVVQNCCKGDSPCQWKTPIFRPPGIKNP